MCARAQERAATQSGNGPLFPFDFPDPFVVWAVDRYYAYATNSAGGAIQLITSPDLASWQWVGAALSDVPAWAVPGATWAPSVLRRGDRWLLYYAVRDAASGRQCLSVVAAAGPAGPFADASAEPLVCELDSGGSIDPSPLVAPDGQAYVLWKTEGETAGSLPELRAQPLRAGGRGRAVCSLGRGGGLGGPHH